MVQSLKIKKDGVLAWCECFQERFIPCQSSYECLYLNSQLQSCPFLLGYCNSNVKWPRNVWNEIAGMSNNKRHGKVSFKMGRLLRLRRLKILTINPRLKNYSKFDLHWTGFRFQKQTEHWYFEGMIHDNRNLATLMIIIKTIKYLFLYF